jgi:monofunctional biosynthetic peptidoglycan transglycosylase
MKIFPKGLWGWIRFIGWGSAGLSLLYFFALKLILPPITITQLNDLFFAGRPLRRNYVPANRVSPHFYRAVIAAEDGNFAKHSGFDWQALATTVSEGDGGGASTISQQTSKNVFLWQRRDYIRKALEFPLTMGIESVWGKQRILEVYVNSVEMGRGIYGVQAASQYYFRKNAANLTPREAATIAALLPNPKVYGQNLRSPYMRRRVDRIQREMNYLQANSEATNKLIEALTKN